MADQDEVAKLLQDHYGHLATDPDFLREEAHLAPARPFPGPPSLYQGSITNPGSRPQDYMTPVAEAISPTLGGYGLGAGLAETGLNLADHEWAKAAEVGVPMALGIFAGPGARTANLGMLARAQEMAAKGLHKDAIWKDTGWFQGNDGKWKWEIDDSPAHIPNSTAKDLYDVGEASGTAMRSGLAHPEFYKAYPEAREIGYRYALDPSMQHGEGMFTPNRHLGSMREALPDGQGVLDADSPNLPGLTSIGLHELQHFVQGKEGFQHGANPVGGVSFDEYRRAAGEVEARNVQARQKMTAEERAATPPWETEDVPSADQILAREYGDEKLRLHPSAQRGRDGSARGGDKILHGSLPEADAGWESKVPVLGALGDPKDARASLAGEPSVDQILSKHYGEPQMSIGDTARAAKAKAMGFNPDRTWYHGSTHEVKAFDNSKSNIESDLGAATYMTSSPEDAWVNYNKDGPDLTSRIEQRAEQIFGERETLPKYGTPQYKRLMAAARKKAEKEIAGSSDGAIYPLHVRDEGILDLTKNSKDYIDFMSEIDDAGDMVAESPNLVKLHDSLQRSASKYDELDVGKVMEDLSDYLYDGVSARQLDEALRKSEGLIYAQDPETGHLASHEIIRQLYEDLGYRGATVDANERFPNMKMPPGTQHRVMFHPQDLRSPFADFNPKKSSSSDILAGIAAASVLPLVPRDDE